VFIAAYHAEAFTLAMVDQMVPQVLKGDLAK